MRNLTIKRNKSFVASLAKVHVFIEDELNGTTKIDGVNCTKLGTLKNGEEKTFEISEASAKVYVISDMLAKGWSNDFYELPYGTDDVKLTGENRYNPGNGNAFLFDGNTSEAAEANRKKSNKKGVVILIAAVIVGFVIGLMNSGAFDNSLKGRAEDFEVNDMTITLNENFESLKSDSYDGYISSDKVLVMALEDSFNYIPDFIGYSAKEYCELLIELYAGIECSEIKEEDGLVYFEYEMTNGETYHYFSFIYKENDAFWLVEFATFADEAEECRPYIMDWAKSVKFD